MPRILAVDPGPTSGIALMHDDIGPTSWIEHTTHKPPLLQLYTMISVLADTFDVLIIERFEFRKDDQRTREKIDFTAAEYVGVLKLWAAQHPDKTLVMQGASVAKGFWTNDKIKRVSLWNPAAVPHGIDALRHLLYYVTFVMNDNRFLSMLRFPEDPDVK